MKKKYLHPDVCDVDMFPEHMLAGSGYGGSGDDAVFDDESGFDPFFGA